MRFTLSFLFLLACTASVTAQQTGAPIGGTAVEGSIPTAGSRKKPVLPPEKASPVRIPFTERPPLIDGKLDDEVWGSAAVFRDFYQIQPGDNEQPSKPTEVYVAYDSEHLYLAFKAWDEPDKIRATLTKRDEAFREDNVRVWLDTFDDQRRAYVLGFNPFGIQQDGIFTEGREQVDFSVDIVMESKGAIFDWGYAVEAKIPFKSLRYQAGPGKFWGFNTARNIDRFNDELNSWMPFDRSVSGTLIKHGRITGLDEIKTERTVEVVPSATLSASGNRVPTIPRSQLTPFSVDPGRFVSSPMKADAGVTVKYQVTPNVTIDAALNPDFAEIEADAPVVTANQRFPIFFEEKRPFFLEGADIFQSQIPIFYSRTIVDPDVAAKISGKTGKVTFGLLAAADKAPGNYSENDRNEIFTRPAIDEFLDKRALFAVGRLKRDFGAENMFGLFVAARSFPEQKNLVGGVDGRIKLSKRAASAFQFVGSNSKRCFFDGAFDPVANPLQAARNRELCGGGSFGGVTVSGSSFSRYAVGNGFAYDAVYDFTEKNYGFLVKVNGRSKRYRADAGFTRRVDTNQVLIGGRISSEPRPTAALIRANWTNSIESNHSMSGNPQLVMWNTRIGLSLKGNVNAGAWGGFGREFIYEEEFGLSRIASSPGRGAFAGDPAREVYQWWAGGNISRRFNKQVAGGFNIFYVQNEFDFDFGNGGRFPRVSPAALSGSGQLDPHPGRQLNVRGNLELTPTDPLRISLDVGRQTLDRRDNGRRAFDSRLAVLRTTYQFTRFLFTRLRVDYDYISARVNGQFLFGYTPGPGTAFYVGYNDSSNYNGFNPFTGQYEPGLQRNSRTFFVRASYLFRKSF
jgi:hypothetical protein